MADFRTHFAVGAVFGVASTLFASFFGLTGGVLQAILLVFVPMAIGSTAPDIDSDSSVPFAVVFGLLSLIAALLVGLIAGRIYEAGVLASIGWAVGAGAFVWFAVGGAFRKFTKHRGMAHSIPASLLCVLIIFWLAGRFNLTDRQGLILGVSFGVGYMLHLVLDEVYSTVDFEGRRLHVKKSLGSALKFGSSRPRITAIVYLVLAAFLFGLGGRVSAAAVDLAGVAQVANQGIAFRGRS